MEPEQVTADRLIRELLLPHRNESSSIITVNAGGIGVWVATTACLVMLAINLVLVAIVMDQSRKVDDLGDYLNAIYMQAPYLKPPKEDESKK